MTDLDQRSNNAKSTRSASLHQVLERLTPIERILVTVVEVGSVIAFFITLGKGVIAIIEKQPITWVAVALLGILIISSFLWLMTRGRDQRRILRQVSPIVCVASSYSLVLVIGLILGSWVLLLPLSDNADYNFEENEQGWNISASSTGGILGKSCKACTEPAFAGRRSLKFEFSLDSAAGEAGTGRINSLYAVQEGDVILAHILLPDNAPINVAATMVLYEDSQEADIIEEIRQAKLVPGQWVPLVWETSDEPLPGGAKLGLKFELLQGSWGEPRWDDAVVYIDSVHIVNQNQFNKFPEFTAMPTEEASYTPTSTPSLTLIPLSSPTIAPINPTLSSAPLAPTITSTISSTPPTSTTEVNVSAPVLTSPDHGAFLSKGQDVKFKWVGNLEKDEFFEVRIRLKEEPEFENMGWAVAQYLIIPASKIRRPGAYEWQVAIVLPPEEERIASEIRAFEIR